MIWISMPYGAGGADKVQRRARYEAVVAFSRWAYERQMNVFSSILLRHVFVERWDASEVARDWWWADSEILERCDRVLVLPMPGWVDSIGVNAELDRARELGLSIDIFPQDQLREIVENAGLTWESLTV